MTGPQAAITTAAKVTASHVAASWTRQAPPPPPPSARRLAPAAGLPDAPHPGRLCTPAGRASAGAGALGAAGVWRARPGPVAARRGGPEPVSDARRPGPSGTARRRPAGEDALDPVTAADQGRGGDRSPAQARPMQRLRVCRDDSHVLRRADNTAETLRRPEVSVVPAGRRRPGAARAARRPLSAAAATCLWAQRGAAVRRALLGHARVPAAWRRWEEGAARTRACAGSEAVLGGGRCSNKRVCRQRGGAGRRALLRHARMCRQLGGAGRRALHALRWPRRASCPPHLQPLLPPQSELPRLGP